VTLVGHTGAGKSSVAKLLNRFYEFQNGRIAVSLKKAPHDSIMAAFGHQSLGYINAQREM
jgi:ABC-type multidrug transport system fused ATPase/permease subunit